MIPFSTTVLQAIESFAARMGLKAHRAPDHSYSFEFERSGRLSITPSQDGKRIIVSLARMLARADIPAQERLLARAGFEPSIGVMVHAGIAVNGMFVLAFDFEEERFNTQALTDSVSKLIKLHDSIM